MDQDLPRQALREHWEAVLADFEATVDELDEAGWTTVALHTGDTTTVIDDPDDRIGLDVLVPLNEFTTLFEEIQEGVAFSETVIYREAAGGVVFLVCVFRDPDREFATAFPAFYPQDGAAAQELTEHAQAEGEVVVYVRPLDPEQEISFVVDDPALVFPPEYQAD